MFPQRIQSSTFWVNTSRKDIVKKHPCPRVRDFQTYKCFEGAFKNYKNNYFK